MLSKSQNAQPYVESCINVIHKQRYYRYSVYAKQPSLSLFLIVLETEFNKATHLATLEQLVRRTQRVYNYFQNTTLTFKCTC